MFIFVYKRVSPWLSIKLTYFNATNQCFKDIAREELTIVAIDRIINVSNIAASAAIYAAFARQIRDVKKLQF